MWVNVCKPRRLANGRELANSSWRVLSTRVALQGTGHTPRAAAGMARVKTRKGRGGPLRISARPLLPHRAPCACSQLQGTFPLALTTIFQMP